MSTSQSLSSESNFNFESGSAHSKITSLTSHIALPSGISDEPAQESGERSKQFTQSLRGFNNKHSFHETPTITKSHGTKNRGNGLAVEELSFGAPQIDLALPRGALATNALHEINPVCHRDQHPALSIALSLAARNLNQRNQDGKSGVILCFLLEDQAKNNIALTRQALASIGVGNDNFVIITAKHKDDLLWAMEEALHEQACSSVVAHLPVIDDPQKQRLSFIAKANNVPTILICNHKSSDTPLGLTTWSVEGSEAGDNQITPAKTRLSLTSNQTNLPVMQWSIKWDSDKDKFHAASISAKEIAPTENTIH